MKSDDFRCKNCGGMMRFDPKSGNLKCENCETEEELPKVFTHKRHDINDYEKRIKRGLYRTSKGYQLNADCNGALNILRKSKVVDLNILYNRGELNTPKRIRVV